MLFVPPPLGRSSSDPLRIGTRQQTPAVESERFAFDPPSLKRAASHVLTKLLEDLDIQELSQSLRTAAVELDEKIPDSGYIALDVTGIAHDSVTTPIHYMIQRTSMVENLREQIASMAQVAVEHVIIYFAGWMLLDCETLEKYGIQNRSQVVVAIQEDSSNGKQAEISASPQPPLPDKGPDRGPMIGKMVGVGYGRPCIYFRGRIARVSVDEPRVYVAYQSEYRANEWINLSDSTLKLDEILGGRNHRQKLLAEWKLHSQRRSWSEVFEKCRTDERDMITLEQTEDEPRFVMPCGHAISEHSLHACVNHSLMNGETTVLCPFVDDANAMCSQLWTWKDIRTVLEPTFEVSRRIELDWSFNAITKMLNAQTCNVCGLVMFRSENSPATKRATCPKCVRLNNDERDEKQESTPHFCWLCNENWADDNKLLCECVSSEVRELLDVVRNCELKKIGRVADVPSVRSCVHCRQLIVHWTYCKHMVCYMCKKSFCFVCLKPYDRERKTWLCGSSGDVCPVAPVQEEYITSFDTNHVLDLRKDHYDDLLLRETWTAGTQVEVYCCSYNAWFDGIITDETADQYVVELPQSDQVMSISRQSRCLRQRDCTT